MQTCDCEVIAKGVGSKDRGSKGYKFMESQLRGKKE